jgi:hypothetical protein
VQLDLIAQLFRCTQFQGACVDLNQRGNGRRRNVRREASRGGAHRASVYRGAAVRGGVTGGVGAAAYEAYGARSDTIRIQLATRTTGTRAHPWMKDAVHLVCDL